MKAPRLILADDHQVLLESLEMLLQREFDVVATASDGLQLLTLCRTLRPDVAVTDIGMPNMSGMEFAEAVANDEFRPRIIFLTMHGEAELAVKAFHLGVAGFVMKHAASSELFTAVREVLAGRTFISPRIGLQLVKSYLNPPEVTEAQRSTAPFTPRQIEVLRLIALGRTMKEVAATLGVSTRTAEAHKYQMMERHNVRTVAELIRLGMELGFVETPTRSDSDHRGTEVH